MSLIFSGWWLESVTWTTDTQQIVCDVGTLNSRNGKTVQWQAFLLQTFSLLPTGLIRSAVASPKLAENGNAADPKVASRIDHTSTQKSLCFRRSQMSETWQPWKCLERVVCSYTSERTTALLNQARQDSPWYALSFTDLVWRVLFACSGTKSPCLVHCSSLENWQISPREMFFVPTQPWPRGFWHQGVIRSTKEPECARNKCAQRPRQQDNISGLLVLNSALKNTSVCPQLWCKAGQSLLFCDGQGVWPSPEGWMMFKSECHIVWTNTAKPGDKLCLPCMTSHSLWCTGTCVDHGDVTAAEAVVWLSLNWYK